MILRIEDFRERPLISWYPNGIKYAVTGSAVYGVSAPKDLDFIGFADDFEAFKSAYVNKMSVFEKNPFSYFKPNIPSMLLDDDGKIDTQELKNADFVSVLSGYTNCIVAERDFVDKWILAHNHLVLDPKGSKKDRIEVFEFYGIAQLNKKKGKEKKSKYLSNIPF